MTFLPPLPFFNPDRMTDPIVPHGQNKSPESDLWKIKQWLTVGLIVSCRLLNLSSAFSGNVRKSSRQTCKSLHSGHHHLLESLRVTFWILGNKEEGGTFDTSHYGVVYSFVQLVSLKRQMNHITSSSKAWRASRTRSNERAGSWSLFWH